MVIAVLSALQPHGQSVAMVCLTMPTPQSVKIALRYESVYVARPNGARVVVT